jgi:hypothetical protein
LTGDKGAFSFTRDLATKQPELYKENQFGTGSEQQNAARTAALSGIQPTGAPEAVGNTVRQQMAAIEAGHDAAVASATADAQILRAGRASLLERLHQVSPGFLPDRALDGIVVGRARGVSLDQRGMLTSARIREDSRPGLNRALSNPSLESKRRG